MLKLLRIIYKNPVGKTFLGLIFAFIFGVSALILSIAFSQQLGKIDSPYNIKETYKFHQWTINYDFLTLDFPEGGYVIPGYQRDRIASVLIIAEGKALFETTDSFRKNSTYQFPIEIQISEVIIPIHYEDFEEIKRDTIFIQEEVTYPIAYIEDKLERGKSLLYQHNILGINKIIPPTPRSVMLKMFSPLEGEMIYVEDEKVSLHSENINFLFNHSIGEKLYPIPYTLQVNIIYNTLLLLAFSGLIAFLTTDFDSDKRQIVKYLDKVPALLHLIAFSLYIYLVKGLSYFYSLELIIQGILYFIPVIYLGYWIVVAKVPLTGLGFNYRKIIKSIFIPIAIFYLMFISATFQLTPENPYTLSYFLWAFLLVSSQQFIFRSFIQTSLEAFIGKWSGILITSALFACLTLIPLIGSNQNNLTLFLSYWAISLILSYSYHRTKNLITPITLIILLSLYIPNLF